MLNSVRIIDKIIRDLEQAKRGTETDKLQSGLYYLDSAKAEINVAIQTIQNELQNKTIHI